MEKGKPPGRYHIRLARDAEKELNRLPRTVADRILSTLLTLELNPRPSGCKKLQGANNKYRLRVGSYRVLYSIFDEVMLVEVVSAVHRKDAYRDI